MVKNKQDDFDLNKELKPYLKHWPWFILSCILFLTLAFFYLRYATPEYNAYAKIMLTHEDGVSSPAGSVLKDLGGGLSGGEKVIEDEIEILKS